MFDREITELLETDFTTVPVSMRKVYLKQLYEALDVIQNTDMFLLSCDEADQLDGLYFDIRFLICNITKTILKEGFL